MLGSKFSPSLQSELFMGLFPCSVKISAESIIVTFEAYEVLLYSILPKHKRRAV